MDEVVAASIRLYTRSQELIERTLADLNDDDLRARVAPKVNPILWMIGHLTMVRCILLDWAGRPKPFPWTDVFKYGAPQTSETTAYPPTDAVLALWKESSEELMQRLPELTPAELSAPTPIPHPAKDGTIRGAIIYLAYHESYHVGQMAYVHKALGKGRISES